MIRWYSCLIALFAASLLALNGCGKKKPNAGKFEGDDEEPVAVKTDGGNKAAGGTEKEIDKPLTATIKGKVLFDGEVPVMDSLKETMAPNPDKACCYDQASERDKVRQTWMVSKDKGVANVIVVLTPQAGFKFKEKKFAGDVVIDQPKCQYVPHVSVIRPGEKVLFKNSAPVNHNVKFETVSFAMSPDSTKGIDLKPTKKPFEIACDSHKWMSGYVWPTTNPYVAVTNDNGEFEIKDVPADTELEVKIWHEAKNFVNQAKLKTKEGTNPLDLKITK